MTIIGTAQQYEHAVERLASAFDAASSTGIAGARKPVSDPLGSSTYTLRL